MLKAKLFKFDPVYPIIWAIIQKNLKQITHFFVDWKVFNFYKSNLQKNNNKEDY